MSLSEAVVVPALERIGASWEAGHISLATLYLSGVLAEEVVAEVLPSTRPGNGGTPSIAIVVLEDHHVLGKRLVLSALRSAGYAVEDYGHGLSPRDVVARCRAEEPRVLLVSTLMLPAALKVRALVDGLAGLAQRPALFVGGAPFRLDPDCGARSAQTERGQLCRRAAPGAQRPGGGVPMTAAMTPSSASSPRCGTWSPIASPSSCSSRCTAPGSCRSAAGVPPRTPVDQVEGQLRLREKFGHDCLVGAPYAAADVAAWGGEVIFRDDGPPNAGEPLIKDVEAIRTLEPPSIEGNPVVAETLRVIEQLAARSHDVPIIGGVVAPFSLPVMQLGFEQYLLLMTERRTSSSA